MRRLDGWFDTYEKRVFWLYAGVVVLWGWMAFKEAQLGRLLASCTSVEAVFALPSSALIQDTFCGRFISAGMDYTGSLSDIGRTFVRLWNVPLVSGLFGVGLFWLSKEEAVLAYRRHILLGFGLAVLFDIALGAVGLMALNSSSLGQALQLIQQAGTWFAAAQVGLIVLHLILLARHIYLQL